MGTLSPETIPTISVISDSVGITAANLARAAASQFGETDPDIRLLSNARSMKDMETFLDESTQIAFNETDTSEFVLYYTLVDKGLRASLEEYLAAHQNIVAVDLITDAIAALSQVSHMQPRTAPGELHVTDDNYFKRIAAMEFTIAHDDGCNPQDLPQADIVLIGVSRSSKTPTSIYLSQQGYKVANIPLDIHTSYPKELEQVDPSRLFGLMTTPDVLIGIRKRRLGNALGVASSYADPESVVEDLEKARLLMRKLGCIVIHTENRAVEETAQEVLRYYEMAHPRKGSQIRG